MYLRIAALALNIRESRQGAVAIHMGLITVAMIGMGALASEIGFVTYKHRQMQSAADAAAFGAAIAKSKSADFTIQADGLAAQVGFVNGANGVTVTVNNPPATGPNTANPAAVEVIIQQPQTLTAVGLFGSGVFNLGVRSVATASGSPACALQLTPSANPGVTISNGAIVNLKQCGLQVCSTGGTALSMSGSGQLNLTDASGNPDTSQSVSVAGCTQLIGGTILFTGAAKFSNNWW
jgi:Flp pilus assembly protein TadG